MKRVRGEKKRECDGDESGRAGTAHGVEDRISIMSVLFNTNK